MDVDNKDDFIGLPDDNPAPAAPAAPADNVAPAAPAAPAEVGGQLLDNDEPAPSTDAAPVAPAVPAEDDDAGQQPTPEAQPAAAVPAAPAPVADPGEFTPKQDYAFDIELANGTKVRIEKPEDVDQLPTDADFGTPANLMKAQAKLNAMTSGIEAERREWEASKQQFEQQEQTAKDTEQRVQTMVAEMDYLETKGRLPKVDPKYENADWTDPEIQKQPGVKERMELLDYRAKENAARTKLNLPAMSLLEAAAQMQYEGQQAAAAEKKNHDAEVRKARGAMVGGAQPGVSSAPPADMIVGEGGSIRDINRLAY